MGQVCPLSCGPRQFRKMIVSRSHDIFPRATCHGTGLSPVMWPSKFSENDRFRVIQACGPRKFSENDRFRNFQEALIQKIRQPLKIDMYEHSYFPSPHIMGQPCPMTCGEGNNECSYMSVLKNTISCCRINNWSTSPTESITGPPTSPKETPKQQHKFSKHGGEMDLLAPKQHKKTF